MYPLRPHNLPIEQTSGHSSYIRLRFSLDQNPSPFDLARYTQAANQWLKDCKEGKYCDGKEIEILSFRPFIVYRTPAFEVDFDIVNAPPQVIDELIDVLIEASNHPHTLSHLKKGIVAYYNLP